jgi:hypothetical protein
MKVAKIVCALLLAFVLVLTQAAPVAGSPTPAQTAQCAKCCGHCPARCCATPANPNSAPRPATPARTATHNDLQIVAAVVICQLPETASPCLSIVQTRPCLAGVGVPLFQRNCIFLI